MAANHVRNFSAPLALDVFFNLTKSEPEDGDFVSWSSMQATRNGGQHVSSFESQPRSRMGGFDVAGCLFLTAPPCCPQNGIAAWPRKCGSADGSERAQAGRLLSEPQEMLTFMSTPLSLLYNILSAYCVKTCEDCW